MERWFDSASIRITNVLMPAHYVDNGLRQRFGTSYFGSAFQNTVWSVIAWVGLARALSRMSSRFDQPKVQRWSPHSQPPTLAQIGTSDS